MKKFRIEECADRMRLVPASVQQANAYADRLIDQALGTQGKGKIVRECYDKLERRWDAYEKSGLDWETARRRFDNFKSHLERIHGVIL